MALKSWTFLGRSLVREMFIETGTQKGDMLANAAKAVSKCEPEWRSFELLVSIECNLKYALAAGDRFDGDERIVVMCGDSRKAIGEVIRPRIPTTFWLDAHYCDGTKEEMVGECECPLLEELRVIFAVAWQTPPLVLIDDALNFMKPWPAGQYLRCKEEAWPSLRDIVGSFPTRYGYTVTIWDNILYCLPEGFFG